MYLHSKLSMAALLQAACVFDVPLRGPTAADRSAACLQVWELATTIAQMADNGLLSLVDGTVYAIWKMRAMGTHVGRGACIFGGARYHVM
jgi:hypothetical protein